MADQNFDDAARRFRSPPYPSTNLAKALDRAKALYAKASHHKVSIAVLGDAWKYGAKSSGLAAVTATLIQYGLLSGQGAGQQRRYQLTETAIRIIRDADQESQKRIAALKKAALTPPIYNELWETYGAAEDVSQFVLRNFLTLDRAEQGKAPFSDQAADDIVQTYKETLAFVGLHAANPFSDPIAGTDEALAEDEGGELGGTIANQTLSTSAPVKGMVSSAPVNVAQNASHAMQAAGRELLTGLLSKETSFRVIVNGPLGVKEIERLIKKLELDKEILADSEVGSEL